MQIIPPKIKERIMFIKNSLKFFALIAILSFTTTAFELHKSNPAPTLKWLTWNEAVELNKTAPKKILVDVYTEWCGWCKRMDKDTYQDEAIVNYLNANYYCVKLDAEMHEDVKFNDHIFKFMSEGRNGVHELAASLMDNNMSYPTIVYLTQNFERVLISPGYKKPDALLPELKFTAEEIYKKKSWPDYAAGK